MRTEGNLDARGLLPDRLQLRRVRVRELDGAYRVFLDVGTGRRAFLSVRHFLEVAQGGRGRGRRECAMGKAKKMACNFNLVEVLARPRDWT